MADFDWSWSRRIERDVIERALTLDFVDERRNLLLLGANGVGKTTIAKNLAYQAALSGHCSS
jgi:DNA replication protein DnaC